MTLLYATLENTPYGKRDCTWMFSTRKRGKYPALVMVHGGGWRSGNKSMEHPMALYTAARGYVTVPVEYRLSPEALYPMLFTTLSGDSMDKSEWREIFY